jgi:hypothetical protein
MDYIERSMRFFSTLMESDAQARAAAISDIISCIDESEEPMLIELFGTVCRLAEECPFRDIRRACKGLYEKSALMLPWIRPLPLPLPRTRVSYFFASSQLFPLGDALDDLIEQNGRIRPTQQKIFEDIFLETGRIR